MFVAKYAPSGSLIWVRSAGGPGDDRPAGITVDSAGSAYVTGEFTDTADFNPSSTTFNLVSSGAQDVFVLKLDVNGAFGWARGMGGAFTDRPAGIIVSASSTVYLIGELFGVSDFDHTAVTSGDTLTSQGGADGFVLSLTGAGAFSWVRQIGGPGDQEPYGLAFGVSGIYVTGSFAQTAFSGGQLLTSNGGADGFLARYSPSDTLSLTRSFGGSSTDRGNAVAADGFGNVYVTGIFRGLVDFDPGAGIHNVDAPNGAMFIWRLDALTNPGLVSIQTIVGTSSSGAQSFTITMDRSNTGSVYLAGAFSGTLDFDPGPGVVNATSTGFSDLFLMKLNPDGSFVYLRTFGATGTDLFARTVVVDGSGSVQLAGSLFGSGPVDLDPGPGVTAVPTNNGDIFVARFTEDPPTNYAPTTQQIVAQGSSKLFSASTFNQIGVSAPDAGNNLRVLVAAINNGTIILATTAGLTFQTGDGTSDPTMTFTGSQAAVNAALNGLRYAPSTPGFTGPAGIQVRSGIASGPTGSVQNTFSSVPITVVAGSCSPRPRVQVQTSVGGGQMQVTVSTTALTGGPNPISGIHFGSLQTGKVTLNGQQMTSGQPVPMAPNTTQVVFTVQRQTAGQPVTIPIGVIDVCGPWQSFVGAGAGVPGL